MKTKSETVTQLKDQTAGEEAATPSRSLRRVGEAATQRLSLGVPGRRLLPRGSDSGPWPREATADWCRLLGREVLTRVLNSAPFCLCLKQAQAVRVERGHMIISTGDAQMGAQEEGTR